MSFYSQKIEGIWLGTDEYQSSYRVGELSVASIVYRMQNHNDHSIGWFDIFSEDGQLMASVGERFTAQVIFKREGST